MATLDIVRANILLKSVLLRAICRWRLLSRKLVFTNGCFDLLHQGHIDYLSKAADMGDVLVVGLNSDRSVKLLNKGAGRPIQNEQSRALILSSLHFVDAVVLFDEATPYELIKLVRPDVLVKGADYDANETNSKSGKYIAGSDIVRANGGEIKTIALLEGYSTTIIEQKIKELPGAGRNI